MNRHHRRHRRSSPPIIFTNRYSSDHDRSSLPVSSPRFSFSPLHSPPFLTLSHSLSLSRSPNVSIRIACICTRLSRMRLYYRECRRCATERKGRVYSFATRCIQCERVCVSSRAPREKSATAHRHRRRRRVRLNARSPGGLWSRSGK